MQYIQAQIDAVNNGEDLPQGPEGPAAVSTTEPKVAQLARQAISATGT